MFLLDVGDTVCSEEGLLPLCHPLFFHVSQTVTCGMHPPPLGVKASIRLATVTTLGKAAQNFHVET